MISCDETPPTLLSIEPSASNDVVHVDLSVHDGSLPKNAAVVDATSASSTASTSTQTPEAFSCYQCTNCTSKSDFIIQTCESDINMCYVNDCCFILNDDSLSLFLNRKWKNVSIIRLKQFIVVVHHRKLSVQYPRAMNKIHLLLSHVAQRINVIKQFNFNHCCFFHF